LPIGDPALLLYLLPDREEASACLVKSVPAHAAGSCRSPENTVRALLEAPLPNHVFLDANSRRTPPRAEKKGAVIVSATAKRSFPCGFSHGQKRVMLTVDGLPCCAAQFFFGAIRIIDPGHWGLLLRGRSGAAPLLLLVSVYVGAVSRGGRSGNSALLVSWISEKGTAHLSFSQCYFKNIYYRLALAPLRRSAHSGRAGERQISRLCYEPATRTCCFSRNSRGH